MIGRSFFLLKRRSLSDAQERSHHALPVAASRGAGGRFLKKHGQVATFHIRQALRIGLAAPLFAQDNGPGSGDP